MKTKLYYLLLLIAAVLISGCKSSTEDLIQDEFREYVRNNFDDPKSFKEIVSIEGCDTMNNDVCVKLLVRTLEGTTELNQRLDSLCKVSAYDDDFKSSLNRVDYSTKYKSERYIERLVSVMVFNLEKNVEMESINKKLLSIIENKDSLPSYERITYKIKYRAEIDGSLVLNTMYALVDLTKEKDNIEISHKMASLSEAPEHITDMLKAIERYMELFQEKSNTYLEEHKSYKELKELL